ncbi:MAG TPA: hypothetical protein P5121_15960, partial [Caldilineaceae bacterium]|nr:hypothetical protein [Caldilineaceae bacterium]
MKTHTTAITPAVVEQAIDQLYGYIVQHHWTGAVIAGPDPVGKLTWRVTRFVRSYVPWLPGAASYVYLQAQGYWVRTNLHLYALRREEFYRATAAACADAIVKCQRGDGSWLHPPIPGRRGLISTVEGVWA